VIRLGVQLVIFAVASDLAVNLVMLIRFLSRSQRTGPSLGELFHWLMCGFMLKPYRDLLIAEGIEPTATDEVLHCMSIILVIGGACGIVLLLLGLAWSE
jgi:hypothetical protein